MISKKRSGGDHSESKQNKRHKPSDVSLNFSLLFFFRHFQGLKILPMVENLPLRFGGGVVSPVLPPSPTIVLWCCSVSSSDSKKWEKCYILRHTATQNKRRGAGMSEQSFINKKRCAEKSK